MIKTTRFLSGLKNVGRKRGKTTRRFRMYHITLKQYSPQIESQSLAAEYISSITNFPMTQKTNIQKNIILKAILYLYRNGEEGDELEVKL